MVRSQAVWYFLDCESAVGNMGGRFFMFGVSTNGSDLANMIRETFKGFEKGI
jgi:hypothetical protein